MTERRYVSDKRILSRNPFELLDDDLSKYMEGYSFVDWLKLHDIKLTTDNISISRDIREYYTCAGREPVSTCISSRCHCGVTFQTGWDFYYK